MDQGGGTINGKGTLMPKMKRPENKTKRVKLDSLKSRTLTDQDQEKVKGGKTPQPGGPIPVPYPNRSK
jgi:hypothetical protein